VLGRDHGLAIDFEDLVYVLADRDEASRRHVHTLEIGRFHAFRVKDNAPQRQRTARHDTHDTHTTHNEANTAHLQ
jgi:hypothetical protein